MERLDSAPGRDEILLHDAASGRWLHFRQPVTVLTTGHEAEVLPLLEAVARRIEQEGLHAAGFLAYEAAPGFDSALAVRAHDGSFPLLWFGLYPPPAAVTLPAELPPRPDLKWEPSITPAAYRVAFAEVKAQIAAGNTYQVNYSYRLHAPFNDDAWPLFRHLIRAQTAAYGAYVDTGDFVLCSASPELFFRLDGTSLSSRPMKGTARRALTWAEDEAQACRLQESEKNRAENVMIVDMIRNDLGRVATVGSVHVPELFTVERYPTVWQMTSTVTAASTAGLPAIFQALFPCASITGAPKRSTMQIIAGLEDSPRQIYTGTIGYLAPGRRAQFNVAIRTVLVDRAAGRATYGVGGGIVWDSTGSGELAETATKAQVLRAERPPFSLLETMLWTAEDGYFLLDYHLERLAQSAAYFGYPLDRAQIRARLAEAVKPAQAGKLRVRLLLHEDGDVTVERYPLTARGDESSPRHVCLAPAPVDRENVFLYHKTTQRVVYEQALAACPQADDVLLWNEAGEVTEACRANVVVELGGERLTPPVSSGLLAGTYRRHLLETGQVREAVVRLADLERATGLWLINSVRGQEPAVLIGR